ncbi:MAG: HAD-IC family P-type ATPase [Rheinheimera sp.]|nr:HAD-IC family P-type ATPase [Rheinheimera sp.]
MAIITGDSSANAALVANTLQIDELYQGCSPEEKVAQITKATERGETVLMVGDGINDSPCFHAAHVSVALDSGTDLSKNQADVVLLHNDLTALFQLIEGAQRARRVIKQNLIWAFGYNLVIIPLAVCGFVSPYIAVIGMSTSSLLVVSNSLRLLKS